MNANVFLLKNLIDVQIIFEIEQEEVYRYHDSEEDVDLNHLVKRIQEVRELKKNYLTILN
jgi:hypothetical protein